MSSPAGRPDVVTCDECVFASRGWPKFRAHQREVHDRGLKPSWTDAQRAMFYYYRHLRERIAYQTRRNRRLQRTSPKYRAMKRASFLRWWRKKSEDPVWRAARVVKNRERMAALRLRDPKEWKRQNGVRRGAWAWQRVVTQTSDRRGLPRRETSSSASAAAAGTPSMSRPSERRWSRRDRRPGQRRQRRSIRASSRATRWGASPGAPSAELHFRRRSTCCASNCVEPRGERTVGSRMPSRFGGISPNPCADPGRRVVPATARMAGNREWSTAGGRLDGRGMARPG